MLQTNVWDISGTFWSTKYQAETCMHYQWYSHPTRIMRLTSGSLVHDQDNSWENWFCHILLRLALINSVATA